MVTATPASLWQRCGRDVFLADLCCFVRCADRFSPCLDERGANSSSVSALSCSPSRIRENSCGFPSGTGPRHDFLYHPSCDNPCGLYHRLGPEHLPLEPRARREVTLALQSQRSGLAKRWYNVHGSRCNPPNRNCPLLESRQRQLCAYPRSMNVSYSTQEPDRP
jgi:hypothetical protein